MSIAEMRGNPCRSRDVTSQAAAAADSSGRIIDAFSNCAHVATACNLFFVAAVTDCPWKEEGEGWSAEGGKMPGVG